MIDSSGDLLKFAAATEKRESAKVPEVAINEAHREISESILQLRDTVMASVEADGQELDPSGWMVYAFDAKTVSAEDAMDINSARRDLNPVLEIDFNPVREVKTEGTSFFSETGSKQNVGGGYTRDAESCTILAHTKDGLTKARLQLLPIANRNPEWTVLESEPEGIYDTIDLMHPKVVSSTKNGEVIVSNVRPKDVSQAVELAQDQLERMSEIVKGIKNGDYHYRVFSNTDRRHSNQQPRFILARPLIDSSEGSQLTSGNDK